VVDNLTGSQVKSGSLTIAAPYNLTVGGNVTATSGITNIANLNATNLNVNNVISTGSSGQFNSVTAGNITATNNITANNGLIAVNNVTSGVQMAAPLILGATIISTGSGFFGAFSGSLINVSGSITSTGIITGSGFQTSSPSTIETLTLVSGSNLTLNSGSIISPFGTISGSIQASGIISSGNITGSIITAINGFQGSFSGSIISTGSITIPSGSNIILQSGSIIPFASPASYIIFSGSISGVTGPYYSINGSTDKIIFSGANANTVIQNTINIVCPSGSNSGSGGTIFIRAGTYPVSGLTVLDQNNIKFIGEGSNTIILLTSSGGIGFAIGNQNATDTNYHARNIEVSNIVFDGGYPTLSNGCAFSIATAFNIWVHNCIFQNSGEVATGGFRISNWNATQILSNNILVTNNYFSRQKISLTGCVNTWMCYNTFDGTAPTNTGRALVDYSKGDISPTPTNKTANTHFDYNTCLNWTQTGGYCQGFQSISNCTIRGNYFSGSVALITTAQPGDTQFDLNGLEIEDNIIDGCTGGISFNYGNNISIKRNRLMTDSTPTGFSTAIGVATGSNANPIPTLIEIEDNVIYKWGGVAIVAEFATGSIKRNKITDANQYGHSAGLSNPGILIEANLYNTDINDNQIVSSQTSSASSGSSIPIRYIGAAKNISIMNNRLRYAVGGNVIYQDVPFDSTVVIGGNSV
jgi:hypothetical protein